MAFWSGKGKTIGRIKTMQVRCFNALKRYWQFKKYAAQMVAHKMRAHKKEKMRKVFQGWVKSFKLAKVARDKSKFDKAVKADVKLEDAFDFSLI